MGNYRFILSGGGTGGHIYPAIAIANELKRRYPDAEFLFVGAKNRMEMEKVPQAGYEIEGLWITGLQRKLTLKNLIFPIKLISSLIRANNIVTKFKPHAVIGTGGFASGPLLKIATIKGIPCLLQEQNSFAGITNKLLKHKVAKICVAYDGMDTFFPKEKIVKTGNPVRSYLVELSTSKNDALEYFELKPTKKTLLVLGGSLGARRINQLVADYLSYFKELGLQVIWQCGKGYYETYKANQSETIKVHAFLNTMDKAYVAADFIISRAGAGAVSELCLVGKPTFFIPSPVVAEDHQTKNALSLVGNNAAIMIREKDLNEQFKAEFEAVFNSLDKQVQLSKNSKALALPNATSDICDEIEKLLK
ncbi:undecaprenyldiphospho-muramoylpentapeptide beta-N-acetylglucosaminyltransferase [Maribacter sp. ACAM166]|uniref:undecaprenyldiphospho-muramoylpentapeptide beta-N-acetylglucosaminyltransferase n=1 Tax=Maribacter sp. ACAM166 TaxID=2508996 RepID=UPI0010FF07EA|nr:undecaprenyldiphospho-muramoylpentapeptide beta-N-acetylglucosaminyltransferase [Maribacter sp. ACAM166]TLP80916.1 undecaprenyldiphospho-muramoylpentapeptide beta-N-acetylglucosaminyltransferase [Maribacter sp. ACAM166]